MTSTSDWASRLDELLERLLDGEFTAEDRAALNALLAQGPEQRRYYRGFMKLHGQLEWRVGDSKLQPKLSLPVVEPAAPIVLHVDKQPIGEFIKSYASNRITWGEWCIGGISATIAMVMLGVCAWMWKIDTQQVARDDSPVQNRLDAPLSKEPLATPREKPQPKPVFVGNITGRAGCQWQDAKLAPTTDQIAQGDRFALKSGLLEIVYATCARVILEGPCTYTVDSPAGGFLQVGKLTAKLEKTRRLGDEETRRHAASNLSVSQSPSLPVSKSLFSVRTPTAVVTDLGTEFGVHVDQHGMSQVVVYVGEVVTTTMVQDGGKQENVHLAAGDFGTIDPQRKIIVRKVTKSDEQFVRATPRLPRFAEIKNASFESPELPHSLDRLRFIHRADFWESDRRDQWGVCFFEKDFTDQTPAGWQDCFLNEGSVWQTLSEQLAPNTAYTLTLWVGNRPGILRPDYTVELLAGNTVLFSEKNPLVPEKGRWAKATLTFASGDAHPAMGKNLKILLRSNGSLKTHVQNHFDDVRLEVTPRDEGRGK